MTKILPLFLLVSAGVSSRADYAVETGFAQLQAEMGAALPTGAGVKMSIVEAGADRSTSPPYLPQGGSGVVAGVGVYDGLVFTVKGGTSTTSSHAQRVASQMAGNATDPALGWASMTPGVTQMDCYLANSFNDVFLAPLPQRRAPIVETSHVQNHSWIHVVLSQDAAFSNDMLRRLDFSIARDRYVSVCGVSNAGMTPDVNAAAYNNLSVGVSSGGHSTGPVTSLVDGPGRLKPEIVAPFDATSWASGYVSSAAALLRAQANILANANATKAFLLKALLLAGATKREFPSWSRSPMQPLDARFGVGELNIAHSFHILAGGDQPSSGIAANPPEAWSVATLISGDHADYRLTIPKNAIGTELSAIVVWERTLSDANGGGFRLVPDPLIDFNLALYRDPIINGEPILMDSSVSTLYNFEHIHQLGLPSGNYRLRVTRNEGMSSEMAIAWRLHTAPHEPMVLSEWRAGMLRLNFENLIPDQNYTVERSANLLSWTISRQFKASEAISTWQTAEPEDTKRAFYRIVPTAQ